jgi:hypothetical protein
MTPNEVAFCKAQRPVLVPKVPVKVMAKPKAPVKSQIWFEMEPYEPATT